MTSSLRGKPADPLPLTCVGAQSVRAYHGTHAKFDTFSAPRTVWVGPGMNDVKDVHVLYFTSSRTVARTYGKHVVEARLRLTNPVQIDAQGQSWAQFGPATHWATALAGGHDGIIIRNLRDDATGRGEPATTYVVFDPEQILSATRLGERQSRSKESSDLELATQHEDKSDRYRMRP